MSDFKPGLEGVVANRRFLLMGDVEEAIDPELVARGLPRVDLLKVAHHGSSTSSSDAFLAAVSPRAAIISVGARNTHLIQAFMTEALAVVEGERLDRRGVLLEAGRRARDERLVREAGVDDLSGHRVRERDVGADVEPEPAVGPLGRRGASRVDRVEARAVPHPLEEVVEEDRMRLPGVRAPEEDHVRLLDLAVRRGPAARSEHRRQTGDARRVSGAVTRVDVVGAQRHPHELLGDEVHLVGGLGAGEHPDGVGASGGRGGGQAGRGTVQGLVPRRLPEDATLTDERLGDAVRLGSPVRDITWSGDHVRVSGSGMPVSARLLPTTCFVDGAAGAVEPHPRPHPQLGVDHVRGVEWT